MCEQSIPQLRLEPCALWRHHLPAVRNVEQLPDAHRVKTKGSLHFSAVHPPLELSQPPDPADKVYPFVSTRILYRQQPVKDIFLEDRHVQHADGVCAITTFFGDHLVPPAPGIKSEFMQLRRLKGLLHPADHKLLPQPVNEFLIGV